MSDNAHHDDITIVRLALEDTGGVERIQNLRNGLIANNPQTGALLDHEIAMGAGLKAAIVQRASNHTKTMTRTEKPPPKLCDFDYAQFALLLCTSGSNSNLRDMDTIHQRMIMMESFRESYNIQDTAEEALEVFLRLVQDHPGILLYVLSDDPAAEGRHHTTFIDLSALQPSKLQTEEQQCLLLKSMHCLLQCHNCHFTAMREGCTFLIECSGMTSSTSGSSSSLVDHHHHQAPGEDLFLKIIHELDGWFPKKQRGLFFYNNPGIVAHCLALWSRHVTPNQRATTIHGCQAPEPLQQMEQCLMNKSKSKSEDEDKEGGGTTSLRWMCKPITWTRTNAEIVNVMMLYTMLQHRYWLAEQFRFPPPLPYLQRILERQGH